ncbi:MAG: hypothetical protein K0U63_00125 [Cyanobacteria bacterium]|nr:hypothetical protein [Cyanobacteriota bacterium]
MEQGLPIRCRAEEATAQLRRLLAGMPFLAERPWQEVGWGQMRIELLSLWRIELLLEPDRTTTAAPGSPQKIVVSRVERAAAPDGRCWVYGCQRDDWTLGPDSRLVEPLEFLSAEQRLALTEELRHAVCWPEPLAEKPATAGGLATPLVLPERIRSRRPTRRPAQRPDRRHKPRPDNLHPIAFPSGFSG